MTTVAHGAFMPCKVYRRKDYRTLNPSTPTLQYSITPTGTGDSDGEFNYARPINRAGLIEATWFTSPLLKPPSWSIPKYMRNNSAGFGL